MHNMNSHYFDRKLIENIHSTDILFILFSDDIKLRNREKEEEELNKVNEMMSANNYLLARWNLHLVNHLYVFWISFIELFKRNSFDENEVKNEKNT